MVTKTDKGKQRASRWIRWGILLAVLAVSTGIGLVHQRVNGVAPAGVGAGEGVACGDGDAPGPPAKT